MEEEQNRKVNPELFKGEAPKQLTGERYYAYIDTVEDNFIRFDCAVKSFIDEIEVSNENIFSLPSIVLELSNNIQELKKYFRDKEIEDYESKWVLIKTSTNIENFDLSQFFNFITVENTTNVDYGIEEIVLYENLDANSQRKINKLIKLTTLRESSQKEISIFIKQIKRRSEIFSHVNVYNVGQGNCNSLVSPCNMPLIYFDVGGGCGANKNTYPLNFRLCHTDKPPIILSHWDLDHIQTAVYDARTLDSKWLVPTHSNISLTAMHIAQTLINKGNLICWNSRLPNFISFNNNFIVKCNGNPKNKNNSGLSLFTSINGNDYTLLPGDARFDYISFYPKGNLIGLVASHHGASSSINGMPIANGSARLAYSFGLNNTHHHPNGNSRIAYLNNGWVNSRETINGTIAMTSGLINLIPPCGGNGGQCTLSIVQQY